jgi:purine-binding chemotaxis protein CheW
MTTEDENRDLLHGPNEVLGDEYLTFRLGEEDYGVDILRVQEIRGWEPVTRIPNAPDYVLGALNLRGSIVPVFDMRRRLGMPIVEYDKETVVIVVKVIDAVRERIMGMVVDTVADVFTAVVESVRDTPRLATNVPVEYITGLADAGTKMIILLDVDRLLCREDASEPKEESAA